MLEHLLDVPGFFSNVHKVVHENSYGLFVCDFSHFKTRKIFSQKCLDYIYKIKRHHYDHFFLKPLSSTEIVSSLKKSYFNLELIEYYYMDVLKYTHNHFLILKTKI